MPIKLTESDKTRFWSWVDISEPDVCWEWQGAKNSGEWGGYGAFKLAGKTYRANRVAFVITNGDTKYEVLHHCNNPACCNPAHLYADTQKENIKQAVHDGRFDNRGEKSGKSKLTEADIHEIRALCADGITHREIAEMFGISNAQVSRIRTGKQWRHV